MSSPGLLYRFGGARDVGSADGQVDQLFGALADDGGDDWLGCGLAGGWIGGLDLVAQFQLFDRFAGAVGDDHLGAGDERILAGSEAHQFLDACDALFGEVLESADSFGALLPLPGGAEFGEDFAGYAAGEGGEDGDTGGDTGADVAVGEAVQGVGPASKKGDGISEGWGTVLHAV